MKKENDLDQKQLSIISDTVDVAAEAPAASMPLDSKQALNDQKQVEPPMPNFDSEISAFKHFFYGQEVGFFNESDVITLASIHRKVAVQRGSLIACFTAASEESFLLYLNSELQPVTLPLRPEQLDDLHSQQGADVQFERLETAYAIAQEAHQSIGNAQSEKQADQKAVVSAGLPAFYFPMFGLQDATLTLFIGTTGAGKSTLINYLLGASMEAGDRPNSVSYEHPEEEFCATSAQHASCTTSPKIYQQGERYYCDLPGLEDTRGEVMDKMAQSSINFLIQSARAVKLVFVIEEAALTAGRALLLKRTANAAKHYINFIEKAPGNCKIMTVITKPTVTVHGANVDYVREQIAGSLTVLSDNIENQKTQLNIFNTQLANINKKIQNHENPDVLDRINIFSEGKESLLKKQAGLIYQAEALELALNESTMASEFLALLRNQPIAFADITVPSASLRDNIDSLPGHQPAPDFFMKQDVQHALFQAGDIFNDSMQKLADLSLKRMRKTEVLKDIKAKENEQTALGEQITLLQKIIGSLGSDVDQEYLHYLIEMERVAKEKYEALSRAFTAKQESVDKLIQRVKGMLSDSLYPIVTTHTFSDPRYGGWGSGLVRAWVSSSTTSVSHNQSHTKSNISVVKGDIKKTLASSGKSKMYDFSEKQTPGARLRAQINKLLNKDERDLMRQIFSNANYANSTFSGDIEAKSTASYELKVTFTKEGYVKNIFSFKSTLSNLKTAWQECLNADLAKTLAQREYAAAKKKRIDYEDGHIIPSVPARRAELEAVLKAKQEELAALSAVLCEMRTELQQLETTIDQLASVLHAPAQVLWFRLLLAFYSVYETQHQGKRVRNGQARLSSVPYVPLKSLVEVRHELREFFGINPLVDVRRCVRLIPDLESKASESPVLIEPVVVLPDAKVAATSVLIEPVVGLPDAKVAATSVPIEPVVGLPDYETAVSAVPAEFSVALPGSGLSSSVDRPALDEKAPHIIHQPCQQRVDSYYYWLALLFQSGALAQSTDCPHAHCDEPITIASLDGSISPAQLAIMAQCLAVLPAPLQAQMSDPYEAVRQALKQPQGDAKSASGSLPSLLQPFASRVGEALASNSSGFYMSLLSLFTQAVAEGVNGCFYPKEFLAHSRGQTYDRMIAGSEFRLSDLSHHFYTHELQVLANLFELNIAVIAKGHEPVIIAPYASTDAQESTDMPAPAYLVLYYEAQGESFAYHRLSFSPDTDLSFLFSRITGVSFTMPVPAEHSDTEETVSPRASYVPIADGPAESPAIEAEVRAVLGASVSGEQSDLSAGREAKLEAGRAALRLTREEIEGDGNCFFSAVVTALRAYSLPNQPATQQAVRDEIAKWASHLASDSPLLQGESLSVYQDAVRTNRWGGEPEFRAVVEIYGVPLVMLSSGNHPALYQPQSEESSVLPRPAMLIEYADRHYNALQLSDPSQSGAWFDQIQGQPVPDLAAWLNSSDLLAPTAEADRVIHPEFKAISPGQTLIWQSSHWVPAVDDLPEPPVTSSEEISSQAEPERGVSNPVVLDSTPRLIQQGPLALGDLPQGEPDWVEQAEVKSEVVSQLRSMSLVDSFNTVIAAETRRLSLLALSQETDLVEHARFRALIAAFLAVGVGNLPQEAPGWMEQAEANSEVPAYLRSMLLVSQASHSLHALVAAENHRMSLLVADLLLRALVNLLQEVPESLLKTRKAPWKEVLSELGPLVILEGGRRPVLYDRFTSAEQESRGDGVFIEHSNGHYHALALSDPMQSAAWFAEIKDTVSPDLSTWLAADNIRLMSEKKSEGDFGIGLQLTRYPVDERFSSEASLVAAFLSSLFNLRYSTEYAEYKARNNHRWSGHALELRACAEGAGPVIILSDGARPERYWPDGSCSESKVTFIAHHQGEYHLLTLLDPMQSARWFRQHKEQVISGLSSWIGRQEALLKKEGKSQAGSVDPVASSRVDASEACLESDSEPGSDIVPRPEVERAMPAHRGVISSASWFARSPSHAQAETASLELGAVASMSQ